MVIIKIWDDFSERREKKERNGRIERKFIINGIIKIVFDG